MHMPVVQFPAVRDKVLWKAGKRQTDVSVQSCSLEDMIRENWEEWKARDYFHIKKKSLACFPRYQIKRFIYNYINRLFPVGLTLTISNIYKDHNNKLINHSFIHSFIYSFFPSFKLTKRSHLVNLRPRHTPDSRQGESATNWGRIAGLKELQLCGTPSARTYIKLILRFIRWSKVINLYLKESVN